MYLHVSLHMVVSAHGFTCFVKEWPQGMKLQIQFQICPYATDINKPFAQKPISTKTIHPLGPSCWTSFLPFFIKLFAILRAQGIHFH